MLYQLSYFRLRQQAEVPPMSSLGGESRIRTYEGIASRFTVCPSWPLWYLPELMRSICQNVEPMEGFEPTTPRLQITCSGQLSYIGVMSNNTPLQKGMQS